MSKPVDPTEEESLEWLLSEPTQALIETMRPVSGDILILGAGGKMGPSMALLAKRASEAAGTPRRILAAARFSDGSIPDRLTKHGIETITCDLFDTEQVRKLPDVPNVLYLVGQKFGTTGEEPRTWAMNAYLPGIAAERFKASKIVAFSTGNVYPLSPTWGDGPSEVDAVAPLGEYAQSALARERMLHFFSKRNNTPMAILRLNYAVEPRYGVIRDIADKVWANLPIDISTSVVNVIWQRDANAIALMSLAHCASPPFVLNVTGPQVYTSAAAEALATRWNKTVRFVGTPQDTALLSNPAQMNKLFGEPEVSYAEMIEMVGSWVEQGGRSLGKPTHFEARDGKF